MREINRNNGGALLCFLRGLVCPGATHAAEDRVQETMLRAWRSLDAVPTEPESQRRWLFTVARRLAIDAYRKRQSRPVEVSLIDAEHAGSGSEAAETVIANLTLVNAIGRLSAAHRSVLLELYVNGHTLDETAGRLGIPVGAVKSRAHYAMQSLRKALIRAESGHPAAVERVITEESMGREVHRMPQPAEVGDELLRLLLSLVGRLPDDLITALRTRLAGNHTVEVAHAIVFAAVAGPVPLADAEADLLIATLAGAGHSTRMAKAVNRAELISQPLPGHVTHARTNPHHVSRSGDGVDAHPSISFADR